MRRDSCASTRRSSTSRVSSSACSIAGRVISWKTIRRTGNLGLQHLEQVPRDRLALAILVRCEQELVGFGEVLLQLRDGLLLVRIDDVERLEAVLHVDTEPRPGLFLVLLRDLGCAVRKVADVADRRLDDEVRPEVAGDRARLGRRLHDNETLRHRRVTIAIAAAGDTPPVGAPPLYRFAAFISRPLLYGPFRLRARGQENVPASGGCVLACNHLSNFDPWPLGMPLWPTRWLRFMAKSELYWWPLRLC